MIWLKGARFFVRAARFHAVAQYFKLGELWGNDKVDYGDLKRINVT